MAIKFFFFWLLAGLLEAPFLEVFFQGGEGILTTRTGFVLELHLASAALLFFSLFQFKARSRHGILWPTTAGFFGLVLPLFGWLAALPLFLVTRKGSETAFSDDEELSLEDMTTRARFLFSSRQERIFREMDFLPLADILAGDDADLKRGAIERLAAERSPEAIDILLKYRGDPSPEVRFYVTSTLARIKKDFDESLEAAKEAMQKDVYKISAHVFLAKTYLVYARSNLLDEMTAEACIREAIYHLDYSIRSPYASVEAYQMLAELYLGRREWDKALDVLNELRVRHRVDTGELLRMKSQIYFQTSRFDQMVSELRELKSQGGARGDWDAIANWWVGT